MHNNQGDRKTLSLPHPIIRNKNFSKHQDKEIKRTPGSKRPLSHEKDLKVFKDSGCVISVVGLSGKSIKGEVVDFDKYTIKMRVKLGGIYTEYTLFKHGIDYYYKVA
jgi:sRNA-binding regulator protein Hfq